MPYQSRLLSGQHIQSNTPRLMQSLAQRLDAFTSKQQDELDRDMMKKAKEQGLADAQGQTAITLKEGKTIADEAWNEGAIASHISAVKLDMTSNLTRIEAESTRDPEGYALKAKGYAKGLLEGVPEQIRPAVQDELSTVILKQGLKIQAEKVSFEREQHLASTSTAIDLYRVEGENQAKEGNIELATDAQMKAMELTNSLERAGLLDPKSAEKQRNDITRDIEDQVIYGAFARDMHKGNGLQYIKRFKQLKSLGDRDPEYRDKMAKEMVSMMDKAHAADDAMRKQEEAERKDRWRLGEKEIVSLDLNGELTPEHLKELVKEDRLDPKIAGKYKKNAMSEAPEFSDGSVRNTIVADPLFYTEFELLTHPDLSQVDREKFIELRRKIVEDKGNWRGTQSGREGARRINQAFGIIQGVDTRVTKEKAQRAGIVLTRYFNEIEKLPLEERELNATIVADKLVKEVQGEIDVEELNKLKDRVADGPYQTVEQIKAANLGSEEEKVQIKQLERKLKRIERLERQSGQ